MGTVLLIDAIDDVSNIVEVFCKFTPTQPTNAGHSLLRRYNLGTGMA